MIYCAIAIGLITWGYGTLKFNEGKRKEQERLIRRFGMLAFIGLIVTSVAILALVFGIQTKTVPFSALVIEFVVVTIGTAIYIKPGYMKDV